MSQAVPASRAEMPSTGMMLGHEGFPAVAQVHYLPLVRQDSEH